jgi:molybdopterin-guanine dinucleotide biosynthesis protein
MSKIVAVCGFSSEVGKTTLVCELLRRLPGWEAVKVTRGHYRSCGKDPHACCVSHLLGDEPLVRSGRSETYAQGKDTGRFWDAGASNVHWVIVTDRQVGDGVRLALERVSAPGVIVEGNSFLDFVGADFAVMVARSRGGKIKPSARRALRKSSALYLSDDEESPGDAERFADARARFAPWLRDAADEDLIEALPVFTREDLPRLVERVSACTRDDGAAHVDHFD